MSSFKLTPTQIKANELIAGEAKHIMLYGGTRSGKTFVACRAIAVRALKAPGSRHAIVRFRFNAVKSSVALDTWPKMMDMCFPGTSYTIDKTAWFVTLPNTSQVWFIGMDDKERVDKILGSEFATIFLNECSQISWGARNIALTRLAQRVQVESRKGGVDGESVKAGYLKTRMIYDQNPTKKSHWSYQLFERGVDPETKEPLVDRSDYVKLQINPLDNESNLPEGYVHSLENMGSRFKRRFLFGEYSEDASGQLFNESDIDKWRITNADLPEMARIVVAVDPSGAGDNDNAGNDAIGIMVGGVGYDGVGYLLEDCTVLAGPATWGAVATSAYDRHDANMIVGEKNFGGAMVQHVIQTARPNTPYKAVTASRGKAVRAEPVSALVETGRVRFVGYYDKLEEELAGFTTSGYFGEASPNRADAFVWLWTELFSGIVNPRKRRTEQKTDDLKSSVYNIMSDVHPAAASRSTAQGNFDHVNGGWLAT
jgi:phage terminase large subunit-like protein